MATNLLEVITILTQQKKTKKAQSAAPDKPKLASDSICEKVLFGGLILFAVLRYIAK